MTQQDKIQLFEQKQVRTIWDDEQEKWFFSIVDAITVLTDSVDPTAYWRKLKQRLKTEGNETVTNCHGLKMRATDGKMRLTDVAELSTKDISDATNPQTMNEHSAVAQKGGEVARTARLELESHTGRKVVTSLNAKDIHNHQLLNHDNKDE